MLLGQLIWYASILHTKSMTPKPFLLYLLYMQLIFFGSVFSLVALLIVLFWHLRNLKKGYVIASIKQHDKYFSQLISLAFHEYRGFFSSVNQSSQPFKSLKLKSCNSSDPSIHSPLDIWSDRGSSIFSPVLCNLLFPS